jgi:hypothetical protein
MAYKPIVIDDLLRRVHGHLTVDDECYYMMIYTSRLGFSYSHENNLISNFKKKLDLVGTPQWVHKGRAILEIGNILKDVLPLIVDLGTTTIVPVPPSKTNTHPHYDNRLNQVLSIACQGKLADIRNLLVCTTDIEAAHTREGRPRPTINELKDNYRFDPNLIPNLKETIMIFDDVLTTGAHYKACKEVIQAGFPNAEIYGFFIARRELPAEPDIKEIFPD